MANEAKDIKIKGKNLLHFPLGEKLKETESALYDVKTVKEMKISVVTWNVVYDRGLGSDDLSRKAEVDRCMKLCNQLLEMKAHILCLTEITETFMECAEKVLAPTFPYGFHCFKKRTKDNDPGRDKDAHKSAGKKKKDYHIVDGMPAIFSCFPASLSFYTFDNSWTSIRKVVLAEIHRFKLHVACVHLPARFNADYALRCNHLDKIALLTKDCVNLVAAGDFNLTDDDTRPNHIPKDWLDLGLVPPGSSSSDATVVHVPVPTFDKHKNPLTMKKYPDSRPGRFDRIYVKNGSMFVNAKALTFKVLPDDKSLSDHFAVFADTLFHS
jgi:hypothetical protein